MTKWLSMVLTVLVIRIVTAIGTGFKDNTQDIKPLRDRLIKKRGGS